MEIPPKKEDFNDEFADWLNLFDDAVAAIGICQVADSSANLPSECKRESAQFLAWSFGQIVATYVLRDQEWRFNLFSEGEFLIEGERTHIWPWDDMWSNSGRLTPLVVGSLLSDWDNSRDWKLLREHYIQMWSGSYTCTGKPLSEVSPEDDLYWAMRIGFVDKMLLQTQLLGQQIDLYSEISIMRDIVANASLRLLKQEHENEKRWDELFEKLPPTSQKIRSRLQQQLGHMARDVPEEVFGFCVEAEQYYENITMQAPAIISFAKAVEACLNHYLVNPLVSHLEKQGQKHMTICFRPPLGPEKKSLGGLRKLSLAQWGDILYMLSDPRVKNLSDLGIWQLREFLVERLGQRLPDFRSLREPLSKIQECRNNAAHHKNGWESPQQDLEQMRALVLGLGGQIPVIIQISRLFAPRTLPNEPLPN